MKILITYTTDGQISIIRGLVSHIGSQGYDMLAWNRTSQTYITNNSDVFRKNIKYIKILRFLPSFILFNLFRFNVICKMLANTVLSNIDIVDYHFNDNLCDKLIPIMNREDRYLLISIWGSDLYRIDDKTKANRTCLYKMVRRFHVESPGVKDDFLRTYKLNSNLVDSINFGISLFEKINIYRNKRDDIRKKMLPQEAIGKIVITCGYNARKGQQHSLMINALTKLPHSYKEKLYVVFPLTYSSTDDSILPQLNSLLQELDIEYKCFTEKLSEEQLAQFRLLSDIVLNTQITDALSSSLMEYFYAENIMMLGDWLPYEFLADEHKIRYIPINISNINEKLIYVIDNYDKEKACSKANVQKVYEFASWKGVTPRFIEMYKSIYNSKNR